MFIRVRDQYDFSHHSLEHVSKYVHALYIGTRQERASVDRFAQTSEHVFGRSEYSSRTCEYKTFGGQDNVQRGT